MYPAQTRIIILPVFHLNLYERLSGSWEPLTEVDDRSDHRPLLNIHVKAQHTRHEVPPIDLLSTHRSFTGASTLAESLKPPTFLGICILQTYLIESWFTGVSPGPTLQPRLVSFYLIDSLSSTVHFSVAPSSKQRWIWTSIWTVPTT